MANDKTTWRLLECGGGSRWSAVVNGPCDDDKGKVCGFSGCGCGTIVKEVATTTSGEKAHKWFRRPKGV